MNNPGNRASTVLAIIITFYIIAIASVTLRVVSRRVSSIKLWWDDWLILLAAVVMTVDLVVLIQVVHYGVGKHVHNLPPSYIKLELLWAYFTAITYALIVTLVKCSIMCLYLRLFSVKKTFTKVVYGFIIVTVAWGIALLFSSFFQCAPVKAFWDKSILNSHCYNVNAWFVGTNVPSIVLDFAILILPMPVVWHLKLSIGRKLCLSGVFLLGTVASITGIFRCIANATLNFSDPSWNSVPIVIWSTLEEDVGVICACLPAMVPLIRLLSGQLSRSSRTTAASNYPCLRNQDPRPLHHHQSSSRLNEDNFELFPERISTAHTKESRPSGEQEEFAVHTKDVEGVIVE